MKIKIISDGRVNNTRIFDAETGKELRVTEFKIMGGINPHDPMIRATITVLMPILDITAEAEVDQIQRTESHKKGD